MSENYEVPRNDIYMAVSGLYAILKLAFDVLPRIVEQEIVNKGVRAQMFADQAAASAAKADSAARNAEMALEEIKKIKGEPR